MSPARRVLIVNRWDDEFAEYHRYLDHRRHRVGYITTPCGIGRIPEDEAAAVEVVSDLTDAEAVGRAADRVHCQLGGLDAIVALSEYDLLLAAGLRERLGVPGKRIAEVTRFRDKTAMKRAVAAAGLRAPVFADCADDSALARLSSQVGFPLVLKPKSGAASDGVMIVTGERDLREKLATVDRSLYECEQFLDGPIYHVDGLVSERVCAFAKVSRYLNTCLAFKRGEPLGSVILEDGDPRSTSLRSFALACLEALGFGGGAFHLELIEHAPGELYFLEVGARVGGGEIPFVIRDLFGVDLDRAWLRMQVEPDVTPAGPEPAAGPVGGFLMVPEPRTVPCVVVRARSLMGLVPHLYAEVIPETGALLDGQGGYSKIGGRFRFRAPTAAATEQAIRRAMTLYELEVAPLAETADLAS
jgi:biotin carboxylase